MYVKVMQSKGQSQKIDEILTKHFVPMIWQAQFDTKFIMIRNRALEIILFLFKSMDPNDAEARVLNSLIQLDAQGQAGLQK